MGRNQIKFRKGDLIAQRTIQTDKTGNYWGELSAPVKIERVLQSRTSQKVRLVLDTGNEIKDEEIKNWEFYPQKNDQVVVAAGTYTHWYLSQIADFFYAWTSFNTKKYSREDSNWIQKYSPDRFPFGSTFLIRDIIGENAVIVDIGNRFVLALNCLHVLSRIRQNNTT